ncbi:ABC transporter ATP-binding protein [Deinococcus yavapaiensis]|uniref:Spermidine/putrescine import ATP-binding protein PotA n=1 Tax=Deinococcus yavapaiensis KR-236 TaxID=694435 RepID=A0A318SAX9_9DEIO|nr:ABC transporter ATP-binding protein [Deinococcus yavapaiensis]PYE56580.1 spermidine/putrescine ABC transporter ATP-binding subunit [Deinococcus yavapaiensis KR-236]
MLADVSLDIRRGEFFSLLGPSGCGKTTLLRILAGFEDWDKGEVLIGGRDMRGVPPHLRDVHTVFQSYALFPHMTVWDNVAFGLRMAKRSASEVRERVGKALELVRIEALAKRRPAELSGGQRQRVALARAIVLEPEVLLLDEPLSALDLKLRKELQVELSNLQETLGITFVFVTHDQEEALVMSDRIAVMNAGRIEQIGRAEDLYERPRTAFVANFLGTSNLVEGRVVTFTPELATIRTRYGDLVTKDAGDLSENEQVLLSVRPEKLRLSRDASGATNTIRARVDDIVYTGAENQYLLEANGQRLVAFQLNSDIGSDQEFDYDEEVTLFLPPENLIVLEEYTPDGSLSEAT